MTDTKTKPDPSLFSVDMREGEYRIEIEVRGSIERTIKAGSIEEARAKAAEIVDDIFDDKEEAELDNVEDARVSWVYKTKPMYLVIRDGQPMKVSHLVAGDLPRQPDERGF